MRKFVWLGILAGVASAALGQQPATKPGNQEPAPVSNRDWKETWRNSTIAFGEIAHDPLINRDFFHALGTGVIVNTDTRTAYLVTARHMFCDTEHEAHPMRLQVRYAWQEHKSTYDYLGVPFILRSDAGADLWSSLDDGSDIAAIRMPEDLNLPVEDQMQSYDSVNIADVASDVYEGESVFVLGYPGIVGNEKLVKPIFRQGIVAWTDPNLPDKAVFLVDANLYQGNSGGPVIQFPVGIRKDGKFDYLTGGKLKLLGVVSQIPAEEISTVVSNPRLGKVESRTVVTGIGAIGIIEPASKIAKLINDMAQGTAAKPICAVPERVEEKPTVVTKPK